MDINVKRYTYIFALIYTVIFTDKCCILHKWINMEDQDNNGKIKLYTYDILKNWHNNHILYAMKK